MASMRSMRTTILLMVWFLQDFHPLAGLDLGDRAADSLAADVERDAALVLLGSGGGLLDALGHVGGRDGRRWRRRARGRGRPRCERVAEVWIGRAVMRVSSGE